MIDIVPAILPKNYEDLKNKVALVRGIVPTVQIDICDGIFVKNKTWPFSTGGFQDDRFLRIMNEEEGIPFWEDIDYELDLMVADAVENFDIYTKLGSKRIIFHLEAVGNLENFRDFLEGMDVYVRDAIEIGVAINIKTLVEKIFPLVNLIDFVQFMGIEKIGFQGEKFEEEVLDKIKSFKRNYSNLIVSVDGGVDFDSAEKLKESGVDRLVCGSVIFKSEDIRETISELEN